MLQLMVQTACAKTICERCATIASFSHSLFCDDRARCTALCSRSPFVLNVAQLVPGCTSSTTVRRALALEPCVSGSLCAAPRPPSAALPKQLEIDPDFDRRASQRLCQACEPGTTCVRRVCRRQCPPARRPRPVSRLPLERFFRRFFLSRLTKEATDFAEMLVSLCHAYRAAPSKCLTQKTSFRLQLATT